MRDNAVWQNNNANNIDDAIYAPSTGDDGANCIAGNADDNEQQRWHMDLASGVLAYEDAEQVIASLSVAVLATNTAAGMDPLQVSLFVDGTETARQSISVSETKAWHLAAFSGAWNLADLEAVKLALLAGNIVGKDDEHRLHAAYVQFSYTRQVYEAGGAVVVPGMVAGRATINGEAGAFVAGMAMGEALLPGAGAMFAGGVCVGRAFAPGWERGRVFYPGMAGGRVFCLGAQAGGVFGRGMLRGEIATLGRSAVYLPGMVGGAVRAIN